MADKLRAQQQLEALQARYIGIGSADTTKHEWTSNIARDSLASYIGHPPLLQYMSIGLGQPREKTRVQLLERMVQPVGPPPEVSSDWFAMGWRMVWADGRVATGLMSIG
jgi:splicing factor 3B subunit 5|tara:strand:- start:4010 stop:4336 length:327 start_codon:yes stop_codon:yes gene_type:complete